MNLILILRHYILIATLIKIQEFKRFLNSVLNCTLNMCNTLALPAQDFLFLFIVWSAILQILLISIPNTNITVAQSKFQLDELRTYFSGRMRTRLSEVAGDLITPLFLFCLSLPTFFWMCEGGCGVTEFTCVWKPWM